MLPEITAAFSEAAATERRIRIVTILCHGGGGDGLHAAYSVEKLVGLDALLRLGLMKERLGSDVFLG